MTGNYSFSIDQETTWNRELTLEQDGDPVYLTGFQARMQLRRTKSQTEYDLSLTTENSGLIIEPLTGKITISITAAQTALLSGSYFYDLELVSGDLWLN